MLSSVEQYYEKMLDNTTLYFKIVFHQYKVMFPFQIDTIYHFIFMFQLFSR